MTTTTENKEYRDDGVGGVWGGVGGEREKEKESDTTTHAWQLSLTGDTLFTDAPCSHDTKRERKARQTLRQSLNIASTLLHGG